MTPRARAAGSSSKSSWGLPAWKPSLISKTPANSSSAAAASFDARSRVSWSPWRSSNATGAPVPGPMLNSKLRRSTPATVPIASRHSDVNSAADISRSSGGTSDTVTCDRWLPVETRAPSGPPCSTTRPICAYTPRPSSSSPPLSRMTCRAVSVAIFMTRSVSSAEVPNGISIDTLDWSPSIFGKKLYFTRPPPITPTVKTRRPSDAATVM